MCEQTNIFVRVPRQLVGLEYQHIHQCCLSVVQVTDNSNVPNHLWERCHVQQESSLNDIDKLENIATISIVRTLCRSESQACPFPQ